MQPDENGLVFFLDRNLGRYQVADALRHRGLHVEVHVDHFPEANEGEMSDEHWIRDVTARGWIIITRDADIRRNPLERNTFLSASARVFNIRNGNAKAAAVADAFMKAHRRIEEIVRSEARGFIIGISMRGEITFRDNGP